MIKKGKVVGLAYTLKGDDGEVLDEATRAEPFAYLHGGQQIVPGLETALAGLKVGDKKDVTVAPAEGYGEMNPELRLTVKRSQFPKEMKLEEGMSFEASASDAGGGEASAGQDDDQGIMFTIEAIEGDDIHLDGNHPLAGVTLHFSVEVLEVRDATDEELNHGHAHGGDGHHH